MKVLFPEETDIKNIKFGDEPIEKFIDGGVYEDDIKNKRIFYVVQPNSLIEPSNSQKQFKIGMSNTPNTRLTNYKNYFGNHNSNKCSGVRVRLILGTNKDDDKDKDITTPNFAVSKVEKKLKDYFKKTNKVDRGSEWLLVGTNVLRTNIQKSLIGNQKDTITHSPHATRSKTSLRSK
jgi:hypothetical protein